MSESGGSSLAISEKRTHRPGGCVGIFFQLFDWNRRIAKKKLFPKKLLSLAPAKQGSKKFGADDKLPKLRLNSDEKNGKKNGTQSLDLEQKHGMKTPSLVARLMGLDSMPAVQRDKLKKSSSEKGGDRGGKFDGDGCAFPKQDTDLEKVGKHERPQKLQKTGPCNRRAVTRFGTEALQFKNVLSRPSKHHSKLPTPVKSPKSLSRKKASRLIGAATRILEPGLQSRNRAKCALPYSNKMLHNSGNEVVIEAGTAMPQDVFENCMYHSSTTRLSRGQSSCRNCGIIFDNVDSRPISQEQRSVSDYVDRSPGLKVSWSRSPVSSLEQEKERIFHKCQEKIIDRAALRVEPISDRPALHKGCQAHWHLRNQQYKCQQASPSSLCYKNKIPCPNQTMMERVRIPPTSMLNNSQSSKISLVTNVLNERKDVIPIRNPYGRTRSRMTANVDHRRYVSERRVSDRQDDPLPSARKRRSVNVSRQGGISGFVGGSTIDKQRNYTFGATGDLMVRPEGDSTNCACIETNLACLEQSNKACGSGNKDDDVMCFTFSSSMKQEDTIPEGTKDKRDQKFSACNRTMHNCPAFDKIHGQTYFPNSLTFTEDALGAVLEQKLKELTSQGDNELGLGGNPSKRTSAMILQELIAALVVERPFHQKDLVVRPNDKYGSSYCEQTSSLYTTPQAKQKNRGAQVSDSVDNNNLSPLSVLEASFSNESCFSSSLDDSSVHKLHTDFMDCSYNEPKQLDPDLDILDSATSLSKGGSGTELVAAFVNHISEMLCNMNLVDSRLKGSKLVHAKEVVLNSELIFGNAFQCISDRTKGFSISRFLVDELETLASFLWTDCSCFSGFEDTEGNLLKGFLFDCVIEYLESRYGRFLKCGTKTWRNLPLHVNTEMMIHEVVEEIRSWTGWAGFVPDELIERETNSCSDKWIHFETEAFETGVAIDGDILQFLVDEIVVDLWQSNVDFSGLGCCCSNC